MAEHNITEARRKGLRALESGRHHGPVRVSNRTRIDGPRSTVYWQVAGWLVHKRLADPVAADGPVFAPSREDLARQLTTDRVAGIELSDDGLALCRDLGIGASHV